MELKNFVDFAYSLKNMDEVVNNKFPLPKEIVFELERDDHINIHKTIKIEKNDFNLDELDKEFEVNIFEVNFKFLKLKTD